MLDAEHVWLGAGDNQSHGKLPSYSSKNTTTYLYPVSREVRRCEGDLEKFNKSQWLLRNGIFLGRRGMKRDEVGGVR